MTGVQTCALPISEFAEHLIRELRRELAEAAPGYEAASLALLTGLIVHVSRCHAGPPAARGAALLRVGEVISRIERDYAEPLTLSGLAAVAGMSQNHLLRLFRAATGSTPIEHLLKVRLRRAAALLRSGTLTIGEIAARCGFNDSNYFAKKFRDLYGESPRSYRRRE